MTSTKNALRRVALLAILALPVARAEIPNDAIGRLFLTPSEREKIEQSRGQEAAAEISFDGADPTETTRPIDETLALNGLIRRTDGTDVVWVNGKMLGDGLGRSDTIKVRRGPDVDNNVIVESAGVPRPVRLKPGQAWDRGTGRVVDCYRCTEKSELEPAQDNDNEADENE